MSANLVVDIRQTCDYRASVSVGSGSNLTVGEIVDLLHANTYTNVWVAGGIGSGPIRVDIQTSDDTTSGNFTDPTSGLTAANDFPVGVISGGIFWANSGLPNSGSQSISAPVSGAPTFASGGIAFGAFQRPRRYARLVYFSGDFPNWIMGGFVSQKHTTGSGGGFDYNPGSGTVSV